MSGLSISRRPIFAALAAFLLLHAGGCAAGRPIPSTINFHSLDTNHVYEQTFPRAYVAELDSGEYDAVLIANENEQETSSRRSNLSGPIDTSDARPLNHVLHIRVLWRPPRGTRADTPTATNAVVTWYVRRSENEASRNRLQYQGAGFVMVYPEERGVSFSIRNVSIALRDRQGDLPDPIGRATLEGNFYAVRDSSTVRTTLETMHSQFPPTTTSINPAPVRTDTGTNPPTRDLGSP